MRPRWTACWGALGVAVTVEALSKWCHGRAAMTKAQALTSNPALKAMARTACEGHRQAGGALAVAGLLTAVAGCVAWRAASNNREAGSSVLPISLVAAYLLLLGLMV